MKGRKKGGEKRGKKEWRKDEIIEREREMGQRRRVVPEVGNREISRINHRERIFVFPPPPPVQILFAPLPLLAMAHNRGEEKWQESYTENF